MFRSLRVVSGQSSLLKMGFDIVKSLLHWPAVLPRTTLGRWGRREGGGRRRRGRMCVVCSPSSLLFLLRAKLTELERVYLHQSAVCCVALAFDVHTFYTHITHTHTALLASHTLTHLTPTCIHSLNPSKHTHNHTLYCIYFLTYSHTHY